MKPVKALLSSLILVVLLASSASAALFSWTNSLGGAGLGDVLNFQASGEEAWAYGVTVGGSSTFTINNGLPSTYAPVSLQLRYSSTSAITVVGSTFPGGSGSSPFPGYTSISVRDSDNNILYAKTDWGHPLTVTDTLTLKSNTVYALFYNVGAFGDASAPIPQSISANLQGELKAATTPIPAAFWILGTGIAGVCGLRRKFKA